MKLRTVKIVIQEDGSNEGKGFKVFLEGDIGRLNGETSNRDLSPAEFHGANLFRICASVLKQSMVTKDKECSND